MDNIKLTYAVVLAFIFLACCFLSGIMFDIYLQYNRVPAIVTSVGFASVAIFAVWRLRNIDKD